MKLPFKGTYRLSQTFGVNAAAYAQFGYKGHNGLDHAVPSGTPLYAMISGKVIEARMDASGYGYYVKIENDKEGALVGHMQNVLVSPGNVVTEGQTLIGYSDNTGNSTGPHTHTGYYLKPRDRANGYGGYIDFTNLLEGGSMTMYKGYDLDNQESMKVAVDVLVRLQNGDIVDKSKMDQAVAEIQAKLDACLSAPKQEDSDWIENGKSVETTSADGKTKTLINYAKLPKRTD